MLKELEEDLRLGSTYQIFTAKESLHRHLKTMHEGCRVRSKVRAMNQESIRVARWTRELESRRCDMPVIRFLTNSEVLSISGQDEVCEAPYWRGGTLDRGQVFWDFLPCGPRLSVRDIVCYEGSITTTQVIDVLGDCPRQKSSSGFDSLLYEFYSNIPDLLWHILANVYTLWQQKGKIPNAVTRDVVTLIKKGPDKGNEAHNSIE